MFLSKVEANLSLAGSSERVQYKAFLDFLKMLWSIRQAALAYVFTGIFSTHEIWTDVVRNAIVLMAASLSVDYKEIIIGTT